MLLSRLARPLAGSNGLPLLLVLWAAASCALPTHADKAQVTATTSTATPCQTLPPTLWAQTHYHIEIQADKTTFDIGETITITGTPTRLGGNPQFFVNIRDSAATPLAPTTPTLIPRVGQITNESNTLSVIAVNRAADQIIVTLQAKYSGTAKITLVANSEYARIDGCRQWWDYETISSESITITVTSP